MLIQSRAEFGRTQPLEAVADRARIHLGAALKHHQDYEHHRIAGGVLLLEARKRISKAGSNGAASTSREANNTFAR